MLFLGVVLGVTISLDRVILMSVFYRVNVLMLSSNAHIYTMNVYCILNVVHRHKILFYIYAF